MSGGVVVLNEAGLISILNDAATRFLGLSTEDGVGKKFGPKSLPGFEASLSFQSPADLKGDHIVFELIRREGKDLFLETSLHRIRAGEAGSPGGWLVILRDVTE